MDPRLLDQLSGTLPVGVERRAGRFYLGAMGLAFVFALLIAVGWLGVRSDIVAAANTSIFWAKLLCPIALSGLSLLAASWSAHPGVDIRAPVVAILLGVVTYWLFAAAPLIDAPAEQVRAQLWGGTWRECPLYIALIAAPLMVPTMFWLRRFGPVAPRASGALAGLFCGTLAASLYSLHCRESSFVFLGAWYLLGALIPAAIGALMGRRLLAW